MSNTLPTSKFPLKSTAMALSLLLMSANFVPAVKADDTSKPAAIEAPTAGTIPHVQNYNSKSFGRFSAPPSASWRSYTPPATTKGGKLAAAAPAAAVPKVADEWVTLQESKNIVSKGLQWQKFSQYIYVKPGDDQLPLMLTFTNNGFKGLKMYLSGRPIATEKEFKGTPNLSLNMEGVIANGRAQLVVEAFGPPNAQLIWKLQAPKIKLIAIKPATAAPDEDVIIEGKNFAGSPRANLVNIGGTEGQVVSGTRKELKVKIPPKVKSGKQGVNVTVGSLTSNALALSIRKAPEITGVNMLSLPPGQPLTITGVGFSPKASENQVTLNGTTAEITSCSENSISIVVPNLEYPLWHVKIKVKTNGVDSICNNTDPERPKDEVNIQMRVIENSGEPER